MRQLLVYLVPEVGLGANGEDRAADRTGVVRPVLLRIDQPRAVDLQDGSSAARLLNRAHHLVDVSLGQGARNWSKPRYVASSSPAIAAVS
ncbi:MAG TPA: hypothetical protein VMA73_10885 [Streptosporangiaceae bacterium]|nr:hypothetical protein [Streptosporangiaceae bacterium]